MTPPITLKPTKSTIRNFIFFPTIGCYLFIIVFLYDGLEISQLAEYKGFFLSVFLFPPALGVIFSIVIVLTARVEIHKEGIFHRGLNKYGFKDLIPWANILDAEIINFNQGRFLKLHIRYNRNALSRNGSKAIDTTNIMLSVKLAPYSDDEILKLMYLVRYGRS